MYGNDYFEESKREFNEVERDLFLATQREIKDLEKFQREDEREIYKEYQKGNIPEKKYLEKIEKNENYHNGRIKKLENFEMILSEYMLDLNRYIDKEKEASEEYTQEENVAYAFDLGEDHEKIDKKDAKASEKLYGAFIKDLSSTKKELQAKLDKKYQELLNAAKACYMDDMYITTKEDRFSKEKRSIYGKEALKNLQKISFHTKDFNPNRTIENKDFLILILIIFQKIRKKNI